MHVDCPLILLLLFLLLLLLLIFPSASVAKEVKAAEQLVRPANAQDAKLEDGHVIGHVHVQRHQLFSGQRMPRTKGAGRVHL